MKVVSTLVEAGADVSLCNADGWSPLKIAAATGRSDIVSALLKAGADVSKANQKDGWTPLHSACKQGSESVVQLLLEAGADMEANNNDGATPLIIASSNGRHYSSCYLICIHISEVTH